MEACRQLDVLDSIIGLENFDERLKRTGYFPVKACPVEILQINVGRKCNLFCRHCHVDAGPERTELMSRQTMSGCLEAIRRNPSIKTIDVTGGAPEMNPELEWFLNEASKMSRRLIVRSNLVILTEARYRKFINIYALNRVEVCSSLPGLNAENNDRQRGANSYERCLEALGELCALGYGKAGSGLALDLVHNPVGAFMPASQRSLEDEYRKSLNLRHGLEFNNFFCLTNLPVGRYLKYLQESGNLEEYMCGLAAAYNPAAVKNVMCRATISVGWDGRLYDCDFNQMLELPIGGRRPATIENFDSAALEGRTIITRSHCYGCTAGSGSSCQGTVA
jgi:radical SAM/Cys-rich protein